MREKVAMISVSIFDYIFIMVSHCSAKFGASVAGLNHVDDGILRRVDSFYDDITGHLEIKT